MEARDFIAHGKTTDDKAQMVVDNEINESTILKLVNLPSVVYREAGIRDLKMYIVAVQLIEKDIESHGFYPEGTSASTGELRRLCEWPLSNTGAATMLAPADLPANPNSPDTTPPAC